jgi:protocatechuate 3,4-dioxygenase beta subunit
MEQSQRRTGSAKRRPSGHRIKGLIIVAAALVAVGDRLLFLDSHPGQDLQAVPASAECYSQAIPGAQCDPSNETLQSQGPAIADTFVEDASEPASTHPFRDPSPRRAWQQPAEEFSRLPGQTHVELCANSSDLAVARCQVSSSGELFKSVPSDRRGYEPQGHAISGHVLSTEGDALEGVMIVALPDRLDDEEIQADANLRFWTKTNSLGAYVFSGLPAGEYTIRSARLGEYHPARMSARTGIDYADLVMSRNQDLLVEGRVFGEFGEPLEGVIVVPGVLGQPSGQTGLDGRFALPLSVSPTVASLTLRFQLPGYREQSSTVLVAAHSADGSGQLRVVMDPIQSWTSLEGKVVDDTGEPLPGRPVELRSQAGRQSQSTTTDKNGRYAFAFVEAPAEYRLLVSGGDGFRDAEERLHVTPHMRDVVVVAEPYRTGTVAGQLVNQSGAPIADFDLVLRNVDSREPNAIVSTDSFGNFEIQAAPAGELVIASRSTPSVLVKGLSLEPGERIYLPLVLDWGQHSIRGMVVDARGNPVPASRVILNWSHQDKQVNTQATRRTATDSQGQFTFSNLGPGPHSLKVDAPGFLGVDIDHDLSRQGYDLTVRLN